MNVGELKKLLEGIPDDMELLRPSIEKREHYIDSSPDYVQAAVNVIDVFYSKKYYGSWHRDVGQKIDTDAAKNWLGERFKALLIF